MPRSRARDYFCVSMLVFLQSVAPPGSCEGGFEGVHRVVCPGRTQQEEEAADVEQRNLTRLSDRTKMDML
ncbi:unnamed protein product [Arctogadus glacialis]